MKCLYLGYEFQRELKMRLRNKLSVLSSVALAAVLVACGGGGSSDSPAATVVVAPVATPAITAGTPADAGSAGTLPMLVFANDGTTSTQNVSVTNPGTSSVMTFTSPSFTLTGATGSSPVWSLNGGGQVKAGGNALVACTAGQLTTPGTETVNKPFQNGARVFISGNLVALSDLTLLKGLSFTKFDCAGNAQVVTFNQDGSVTFPSGTGSASQVLANASANGFTDTDGSNSKLRAYKYTVGTQVRYFIVNINRYSNAGGANIGNVALFSQN
jgi:hypothetical protein